MGTLIISRKSKTRVLEEAKELMKKVKRGEKVKPLDDEISFESNEELIKFLKNIDVVFAIKDNNPESIYDLAKILNTDISNLRKVIDFFCEMDIISIEEKTISGRVLKKPIVAYSSIEIRIEDEKATEGAAE